MINYVGTISWSVPLDPCKASLEKIGNRLVGYIELDSSPGQQFAIELDFASATELRNIRSDSGPLGALIGIIPSFTSAAPTTNAVALDLSTIVLTDAPFIHVDPFVPLSETSTTFSLNLSQAVGFFGELADDGIVDIAAGPVSSRQLTPVRINELANTFDHHGALTGVERHLEEGNSDYLRRIESARGLAPNATATGLQNGLSRQLGLEVTKSAVITLDPASPHDYVSAHLEVTPGALKIYSNWIPRGAQEPGFVPTIEFAFTLEGITIDRLAAMVNSTGIFQMQVESAGTSLAEGLLTASTRSFARETISAQEKVLLKHKQVIPGTLRSSVLARKRAILGNVLQDGDFHLAAAEGLLTMFSPPSVDSAVTYVYAPEELELTYAIGRVVSVSEDASSELFFAQVATDLYDNVDDRTIPGLPTNRGYSVMRRLLEGGSYPQFWGE